MLPFFKLLTIRTEPSLIINHTLIHKSKSEPFNQKLPSLINQKVFFPQFKNYSLADEEVRILYGKSNISRASANRITLPPDRCDKFDDVDARLRKEASEGVRIPPRDRECRLLLEMSVRGRQGAGCAVRAVAWLRALDDVIEDASLG